MQLLALLKKSSTKERGIILEETITEIVEKTAETVTPEQAEKIIELLEDINVYLGVNQELMISVIGILGIIFLFVCFKACKSFIGMFF